MESLRQKLITHFTSMMATVSQQTGSLSGQLSPSSAERIADSALGIVRAHDEERARYPGLEPIAGNCAADPELALLAHVIEAFDDMGDLQVGRVMSYLSDRYPPE